MFTGCNMTDVAMFEFRFYVNFDEYLKFDFFLLTALIITLLLMEKQLWLNLVTSASYS